MTLPELCDTKNIRRLNNKRKKQSKKRYFHLKHLLQKWAKPGVRVGLESGVWRFLSDSEWSRSAVFVNFLESESRIKFQNRNQKRC